MKLTESTHFEDTELSYDMVFVNKIQISVRIRRYKYLKYSDFTIRSRSANGYKTEIDKLIEGYGQIYFYGWLNQEETKIVQWWLVDIDKIRHLLSNGSENSNDDGTKFKYYKKDLIIQNNALINECIYKPPQTDEYEQAIINFFN